jgi:hypothetical protein
VVWVLYPRSPLKSLDHSTKINPTGKGGGQECPPYTEALEFAASQPLPWWMWKHEIPY